MKRFIIILFFSFLFSFCSSAPAEEQDVQQADLLRVSVIGDSISTFDGWIPKGYNYHYPSKDGALLNVADTYWYRLIYKKMSNAMLDKNISLSSSTVTKNTEVSKDKHYYGRSFTERFIDQDGVGNPDIVIIHGGTNDRGHNDFELFPGSGPCKTAAAPMEGDLDEVFAVGDAARTRNEVEDLPADDFCSAYVKLIRLLQERNPKIKIVCIIGDYITEGVEGSILQVAEHYGAKVVNLLRVNGFNDQVYMPKHDWSESNPSGCHPGIQGMHFIADKIYDELEPWLESE